MSQSYLDYIREQNKHKASICAYCHHKAVGIIAVGYRILYVCHSCRADYLASKSFR